MKVIYEKKEAKNDRILVKDIPNGCWFRQVDSQGQALKALYIKIRPIPLIDVVEVYMVDNLMFEQVVSNLSVVLVPGADIKVHVKED